MYSANKDAEEIIWKHSFGFPDNKIFDPHILVKIDALKGTELGLFTFLETFERDLIIKKRMKLKSKDNNIRSSSDKVDLYFLYSDKNYIVLQGITYCASFTHEPEDDDKRVIFKKMILNQ